MLSFIGCDCTISNEPTIIQKASHLILPGVGSFFASMNKCKKNLPLDVVENEVIRYGKPFLGICVGMQLLANRGDEGGECSGLGWITGEIRKIKAGNMVLPHVGWNTVRFQEECSLIDNLEDDYYFTHSYCFVPSEEVTHGTSNYGESIFAAVQKDNIFGVQFHPEKSQHSGIALLNKFLKV